MTFVHVTGVRRRAARASLVGAIALCLSWFGVGGANAQTSDQTIYPPSNARNGQKVYLSQSCHNGTGSTCRENVGCNGYQENFWSSSWASKAAQTLPPAGAGLVDRGYTVKLGRGTTQQNISNSNAWGATMHVPLHSNARELNCATNTPSYGGTWVLYRSSQDQSFSNVMKGALAVSPGSNDKIVYDTGLGELNQVDAPTAYMETEFHTWLHGTTFLGDPWQHSWLIALGIDQCRGYPRAPSGAPTRTKACNW